jgi:O-antigen/teichoic acid export membrane protein
MSSDSIEEELQRGALVNVLGTLGKIAGPSFLILVTRLYGADVFGIFITATSFVEMALAFLTAGFKDGALMSVARHADYEDEKDRLYQLLSNTLGWSLLFAVLLILLAFTAGQWVLPMLYEEYGGRLLSALQIMVLVLPVLAFDRIVIAATQGLKIMKYDAISNGGLRPLTLLGSAVGFWFWLPTETGLALAYLTTQLVLGGMALWFYTRELEWRPLIEAFRTFELDRDMLAFAIPQNFNMTLERFITNIDVIMLGMFGVSASTTGFYGAGAMIVRELLNIKQVFSNAFVPHVVRLHREDRARFGRSSPCLRPVSPVHGASTSWRKDAITAFGSAPSTCGFASPGERSGWPRPASGATTMKRERRAGTASRSSEPPRPTPACWVWREADASLPPGG